MKRVNWLLVTFAVAMIGAGTAVAVKQRDRSTSSAKATFAATKQGARAVSSCKSSDGTFQVTDATYSGDSDGDGALKGPIQLSVRAAINTSDRLGTVDGNVVVRTSGRDTRAHLAGVYDSGKVSGLLTGEAQDPGRRLVATFSASYSSDGGFTDGTIGAGNVQGTGVLVTPGECAPRSKPEPPKPVSGQVKVTAGLVSALTTASITIGLVGPASLTCSLDDHARAEIARQEIAIGSRVSAACTFRVNAWALVKIRKLA